MLLESIVPTSSAALYTKKLCRHFAHKVPASLNAEGGIIVFPFGRCLLHAGPEQLKLTVELADPDSAETAEKVVGDHLRRMASKEELTIEWVRHPI